MTTHLPRPSLGTNVRKALDILTEEYMECFRPGMHENSASFYNPPKITRVLGFHPNGTPRANCASMFAILPKRGYYGTKTVSYVEHPGEGLKRQSVTTLFKPNGELLGVCDSEALSAQRCGLLAAMALEIMLGKDGIDPDRPLALLGPGTINSHTAYIFKWLYGFKELFVYGPRPGQTVDSNRFGGLARKWSDSIHDMPKECRIVISASTAFEKSALLSRNHFRDHAIDAFIALDGGYLLDASFRRVKAFTDCTTQLGEHWNDEFPHDLRVGMPHGLWMDLAECKTLAWRAPQGTAAFLYGIALADIVAALVALEPGIE